jgi:hypothetical protein
MFAPPIVYYSTTTKSEVGQKVLVATSFVILCLGFIYFAHSTSAVNRTWDGGGSTSSWSEAANWSGCSLQREIAVFDGTARKMQSSM